MKLYHGGYGKYQTYVVAENEEKAIEFLKIKFGIDYLPFAATEINNIDGYTIQCVKEGDKLVKDKGTGGEINSDSERAGSSQRGKGKARQ